MQMQQQQQLQQRSSGGDIIVHLSRDGMALSIISTTLLLLYLVYSTQVSYPVPGT